MKNSELIADFLNKVVAGDTVAAKEAFSLYCNSKAKDISLRESAKAVDNTAIFERLLKEFVELDAAGSITLDASNILVNGKPVGRLSVEYAAPDANGVTDIEADTNAGYSFTSAEGNFSKEFADMNALVVWVADRYLGGKK